MNLAIASPSVSTYSETFIRSQFDRLPHVLRIHGGPIAAETVPGGPIEPMRTLRGLIDTAYHRAMKGTGWDGPQSVELSRRMRRFAVEGVLANFGPTGAALLPICQRLSLPLIVHFHGVDAHSKKVTTRHREAYRRLGRGAVAVVAVSHVMREALQEMGIPADKIHVLRYGADPESFPRKTGFPDTPVFVAIGRFVDKKAPHLTVLAFRKVQERLPEARLVFGGDGRLLESTRNVVDALGLKGSVEFPGILKPSEVAKQLREATAFVQHSVVPRYGSTAGDSEGTPVVVLEAMMTGVPIVATRHAGIGEVIRDRETGLLVEERDVEGMARAMIEVAESRQLAESLGEAANQEAMERYTSAHYIEALQGVIAGVSDSL
jgi:colanic acid/amylovoran biosynthesis glycosyltransferase